MTNAPSTRPLPRSALLGVLAAMCSHVAAVFMCLRHPQPIAAWQWALMMAADAFVGFVALARPAWFRLRNFRLPGVFVVTTSFIILVPLPLAVRRYGALVPQQAVVSIALGLIVMFAVVYVLTSSPPPAPRSLPGQAESALPWLVLIGAVVLLPIWVRSIGSIPLLHLLSGTDVLQAAADRNRALDGLSSGALRAAVGGLRNLYLMFAVGYLVASTAHARRDWREATWSRIIALIVFGIAGIYALLTTERAILGEYVLVAGVAWLISHRRELTARHLAAAGIAGMSFPIVYALLAHAGGLGTAIRGLQRRILFLPDDVMLHYFIAFPREHPFLHGASIPKLSRIVGGSTFDISTFIYDRHYRVDASLSGVANGSFFGVGWANWGLLGVVGWCAVAAIGLILVERLIAKLSWPSAAAVRGIAVVQTALLTSSDITRSIVGFLPGLLDLPIIVLLLAAVDRRFAKSRAADSPPRTTASAAGVMITRG